MPNETLSVIWQPRDDVRKWPREFDWICTLLPEQPTRHIRDGAYEVVRGPAIVIVDGYDLNSGQLRTYFRQFRASDRPFLVVHVGDEHATAPLDFYDEAPVVYRNYWRVDAAQEANCRFLPLGPNGSSDLLQQHAQTHRTWRWSFAGQSRPARWPLIRAAQTRNDGRLVVNRAFNSGLDKEAYARLLGQSDVVLCPRGWSSVECYRVYEALEAGALPLVEDDGGMGLMDEHLHWGAAGRMLRAGPRYWIDVARRARRPSYWQRVFGLEMPLPRIYRWENLDDALARIRPGQRERAVHWWHRYKQRLRRQIADDIAKHLAPSTEQRHTPTPNRSRS